MTKSLLFPLCGAMLLVLSSCSSTPTTAATVDTDAEGQKIRELEAGWNKDWAAKDIEKGVAHYADDAVLMSPGMPPAKGKDAIRNVYKSMVGDPNLKLEFTAQHVEVSKSGDLAFTQGPYTMTMSDPKTHKPMSDKGSYVTVYRKQADGNWKAVSDIASSEMPPPESH